MGAEGLLAPPRTWRVDELWDTSDVPPAEAGVYGMYFDRPPADAPVNDCVSDDGRHLLYVGIAPARPGSRQTLRRRLRQHFRGNARSSTLRKTLGCLLQEELGLEFRRLSARSARFTPDGEASLSAWMAEHVRVAWCKDPRPWLVEERLIAGLSLPLNLRGNERHPFHPVLRRRRAEMVASARERPIWRPGASAG